MHKDAGIPVYPVVEGMPIKPEWLRQDVEKEFNKILEDPSNSVSLCALTSLFL